MKFLVALALALFPSLAFAQGALLQGGPWTPGHMPQYVGQGSGQAVVSDGGAASGGAIGANVGEIGVVARGTGTAPYAGQGTGPYGTNICDYDAPTSNAAGYHYLCFSANAQGGALLAYGSAGAATPGNLQFIVNGAAYTFPFTGSGGGNVVGPGSSTVNDIATFNSSAGSLLKDSGISLGSQTQNLILGTPSGTPGAPSFRALVFADLPITGTPLSGYVPIGTGSAAAWTNLFGGNLTWTGTQTYTGTQGLTNPAIKVGSTSTWLSTYTDYFGAYEVILSPLGTGATAQGMRSSDYNVGTAPVSDLITSQVYAIHDNTTNAGYNGIWGNYWLAQRTTSAYSIPTIFGLEASFVNQGVNVTADPYNASPAGLNTIMRLDSGVGSAGPNIVTGAIEITSNGSTFFSGLKITSNALTPFGGFEQAIQLASGHTVIWYSAANTISGFVQTDSSSVLNLFGANGIATNSPLATELSTAPSSTAARPLSFSSTVGFGIYFGLGAPTVTAAQGSIYLRNDAGAPYFNNNGSTGWDQFVGLAATQTLTGKTLASPTFTGTMTMPDSSTWGSGGISTGNQIVITSAAKTLQLKQGANGSVGTFICTSGGTIAVGNTNVAISDAIIISLNTVGGTVTTSPSVKTITAATGFSALCATNDTSTYNYALIKNAA